MKKSINYCQRYCQLLRQRARYFSQQRTQYQYAAVTSQTSPVRLSYDCASVQGNQRITGAYRGYCTVPDSDDVEEEEEDTEVIHSAPLHRTNIRARFRTENNDPTKHTLDDKGLYYVVPNDDYEKYVQNWQWAGYLKQVKTFQECAIMVRRPALDSFDIIDNANFDCPPIKLVYYGKYGAGKTMTMAHVLHRYAKSGWVTIHLPSIMEWLRYRKTKSRAFSLSSYKDNVYDYTDDAFDWLIYFKKQNGHLLQNFKTTKDYTWSLREKTLEGSGLLDIIDFGIDRRKYASDCIGVLFKEIKQLASEKKLKVLVAVEGLNGFWRNTSIKDEERKLVNAQKVSTFRHFLNLYKPDWNNGVCIGTVCQNVDTLDEPDHEPEKVPYTPKYLLKDEGFQCFDPFVPMLVPEYSPKEAHNCIDYYIERKWIIKPRSLTEHGKKELVLLSNHNPKMLMEIAKYW